MRQVQTNYKKYAWWLAMGILLGSGLLYNNFLYFTSRQEFWGLSFQYGLLFLLYYLWIRFKSYLPLRKYLQFTLISALVFRLIASFALPELSDDYFRFVWDGRLLSHGENPFLALPAELVKQASYTEMGLDQALFEKLNSPKYFTIYPPVNQFIFWLGASLSPNSIYGSVLMMKLFMLLGELLSIFLLYKLLQALALPLTHVAFYALNPLIIIELCGNLHFEALMICFLLWSIWLLFKGKWLYATIPFSLAICSKLLPLMFLPLLINRLGWIRAIVFGALCALCCLLMFIPLFDHATFLNLMNSAELYFQRFEFNASVYYILRWIGFQVKGYNLIATFGKVLPMITFFGILMYAYFEPQGKRYATLARGMMWCLGIYLLFSSIVHPWYSSTMIAFCILTSYRFPLIWSFLIFGSYAAYQTTAYTENLWLVGLSYLITIAFMLWEIVNQYKPQPK